MLTCLLTVLPVAGMKINHFIFQWELHTRYMGLFAFAVIFFLITEFQQHRKYLIIFGIALLCFFALRNNVLTEHWLESSNQVKIWLNGETPRPPSSYGSAICMPSDKTLPIAQKAWSKMK